MKQSFTPEEVNKIENDSFLIGMITGETKERNRILDLLNDEASEWLSHDGECDCKARGEEGKRLIELIEGRKL